MWLTTICPLYTKTFQYCNYGFTVNNIIIYVTLTKWSHQITYDTLTEFPRCLIENLIKKLSLANDYSENGGYDVCSTTLWWSSDHDNLNTSRNYIMLSEDLNTRNILNIKPIRGLPLKYEYHALYSILNDFDSYTYKRNGLLFIA